MSETKGNFEHLTVLLQECVEGLAVRDGGVYVDVTLGGGGHAEAILEASAPSGRLIGIDRDPAALEAARGRLSRFGSRVQFVHGSFGELEALLQEAGVPQVDGLMADLGVSSPQLDHAERGFSFRFDGPLDMRMDPTKGPTAAEFIRDLTESELADVIFQFGEDRKSRRIARSIKWAEEANELSTTEELRRAIERAVGPRRGRGIDPSTRTFQALRIAVNQELKQLDTLLRILPKVLVLGGAAAIISFHSLEDRRVKYAFRDNPRLSPRRKKPIIAGDTERDQNRRSRSAKLRVATRVDPEVNAKEKSR